MRTNIKAVLAGDRLGDHYGTGTFWELAMSTYRSASYQLVYSREKAGFSLPYKIYGENNAESDFVMLISDLFNLSDLLWVVRLQMQNTLGIQYISGWLCERNRAIGRYFKITLTITLLSWSYIVNRTSGLCVSIELILFPHCSLFLSTENCKLVVRLQNANSKL